MNLKYKIIIPVALIALLSVFSAFKTYDDISEPLSSEVQPSEKVKWMTFNQALEASKKEPRFIIVDMYTPWCGWCKVMDKKTFANPEIAKYINEKYYAVKFNAEGNEIVNYNGKEYKNPAYKEGQTGRNSTHELSRFLGVSGYPTMVYLNKDGSLITPMSGYQEAKTMESILHFFVEETQYNQTSFDNFMKNFKGKVQQ